MSAQKPLELILARNLLSSISTPAFLVGEHGALLFFNDAAAAMLGRRFEETGHDDGASEWTASSVRSAPTNEPIPYEQIPATAALRKNRPFHGDFRICGAGGKHQDVAASAIPIVGCGRLERRDRDLLATGRRRAGRESMKIKVWGARGSIPAPGPETMRYGGNTSCVELTLSDGSTLILDAGTGIRNLGLALPRGSSSRSTSCSRICTSTTSRA